jgi:nitroimidazol reductase NimA-like FMN-containing flavoprotein (pyridoxamine 5'-phosphate oxidase superfamily)
MVQMDMQDIENFLSEPRFATFATVSSKQTPQLTTVWFLYANEIFYFGIERSSVKYKNIKNNSNVSVCIDGDFPDARTLVVYGNAQLMEVEADKAKNLMWDLTLRYHENEQEALEYQKLTASWDLVLVKLVPAKIIAMDFNKTL